jgi:hypothetical protein
MLQFLCNLEEESIKEAREKIHAERQGQKRTAWDRASWKERNIDGFNCKGFIQCPPFSFSFFAIDLFSDYPSTLIIFEFG